MFKMISKMTKSIQTESRRIIIANYRTKFPILIIYQYKTSQRTKSNFNKI